MALKGNQPKPAPGFILVKELDPAKEKTLISGSSLELSGGGEHDQLKMAEVLANGGPTVELQKMLNTMSLTQETLAKNVAIYFGWQKGDVVAYQSLAGHKLRVSGAQFILIPFEHVIAVVEAK